MQEQTTYRSYLLVILAAILASSYLDRLALGLLLQDIKVDLDLSDTQLGVLSGIAFAVFYSIFGIPIARWTDKGNRVLIISITTAMWSAAVALCGLAGSFLQLLLIRIGAAVGEAGCVPPAHSLIPDYFSRGERPRAVALYKLGWPLSALIGYFLAGWLNELYGWRMTFVLLGLPGIPLAILAWFTLREPRRANAAMRAGQLTASEAATAASVTSPPFAEVCRSLSANTTFRHLLFCFAVVSFFGYGIVKWQPAFFIRSYGLGTGELGTWMALISGIGGFLGIYWGGEWASRYAPRDERLQLKVMAAVYCGFGILTTCIYLTSNRYIAFALMAVSTIGVNTVTAPLLATIQTLVPDRMRGMSIAIIYLFANLIGMGLGPLVAGVLGDAFRPWAGEESLRYALLALSPGYLWGAWHLWRGSRTVTRDLEIAKSVEQSSFTQTSQSHA